MKTLIILSVPANMSPMDIVSMVMVALFLVIVLVGAFMLFKNSGNKK